MKDIEYNPDEAQAVLNKARFNSFDPDSLIVGNVTQEEWDEAVKSFNAFASSIGL